MAEALQITASPCPQSQLLWTFQLGRSSLLTRGFLSDLKSEPESQTLYKSAELLTYLPFIFTFRPRRARDGRGYDEPEFPTAMGCMIYIWPNPVSHLKIGPR